ncbi:MAG: glycosyltransferase family 4 protein [Pseudomonadota bacterium]
MSNATTELKVAIVLPRGMVFSNKGATSIDLVARDLGLNSRYRATTRTFGAVVDEPFDDLEFIGVHAGSTRALMRRIAGFLIDDRPDIVVCHQHLESAAYLQKKLKDVPVVLHRHGLLKSPRNGLSRWLKARQLEKCAALVFVSSFLRDRFAKDYPAVMARSWVVHNGVDTAFWKPAHPKEKLVAFAGRARADKGVNLLVECFQRLEPSDWRLSLCLAAQTPDELALARSIHAAAAGAANLSVQINASVEQVQAVFATASIAALPSLVEEGYHRAAIEALACGCLVIASDRGGAREALAMDGILLKKTTSTELMDALRHATSMFDESSEGERRVDLKRIAIQERARQYDDLLLHVAGKAKGAR